MFKFVRDGVEWHGFHRVSSPSDVPVGCFLVLIWFDGEPDLWATETEDIESLQRYYRREWPQHDIPFTISRVVNFGLDLAVK